MHRTDVSNIRHCRVLPFCCRRVVGTCEACALTLLLLQMDVGALESELAASEAAAEPEEDSDMEDIYDDPKQAQKSGQLACTDQQRQNEMLYTAAGQHNPKAARVAKKAARKRKLASSEAFDFAVLSEDATMAE